MHSIDKMRPEDSEMQQALSEQAREMALGPTGQFPGGQITPSDQGEIKISAGIIKGKVILNFGSPVQALGFTAEQARGLARILVAQADKLDPHRKRHGGK